MSDFDYDQAKSQLKALGYTKDETVYLRAFYPSNDPRQKDDKGRKCEAVASALPIEQIQAWHQEGRGVYFVVNGGGHRKSDVHQCRAIFYEHDNLDKVISAELWRGLELPEPTLQVDTGGKSIHSYWVLSEPIDPEQWQALQIDLSEYADSDRNLKDPSRVMRLAGAWHQETQQQTQIVLNTGKRYSFDELREIVPTKQAPQAPSPQPAISKSDDEILLACLAVKHRDLVNSGIGEGRRNASGAALARDLIGAANWLRGQGFYPNPRALFEDYCGRCSPPLEAREAETIWKSAEASNPGPSLSEDKLENCLAAGTKQPKAKVATSQANQAPGEQPAEGKAKKGPPVFKLLMEIAENCDLWHSDDGVAYADVEIDGIRHTYPIRRKAFKTWLSSELYKRHETGANSEAMASCLNVLEAKATFEGQERKVFLRTGQDADGTVYIDLANPAWEVAKVTAAGWEVIASKDCPIRFSRNEGQLPLPNPERGGDLSKLWDVVAVNENYRGLVLAWLAFCFVPNGSKPILTFHGAKGAGKSWATQVLKSLIDPGKAALLPAVGDRRGLAVAASNRWVLSYDNLTALSTDQQDALCCAATGAGFSHRTLHTDLDETFIEYTRPQILTSVDLVPTRSDLLDRCLLIKLDRIPDSERKTEAELKETLTALSSGLFGALLDVVAGTLGTWGTQFNRGHNQEKLPRLADFGLFAIKAETALGLESGGFMATYQSNIETAQNEAIEANPIAAAILALMGETNRFDGTASELVAKLKTVSEDAKVQKLSSRTLGKTLSGSLKQDLEAVGIECDNYRVPGGKRERKWLIYQSEDVRPDKQHDLMSQMSQTSRQNLEPIQGNGFSSGHEAGHQTEIRDIKTPNVPQTSLNVPPDVPTLEASQDKASENERDMRDVWDMKKSCLSGDAPSQEFSENHHTKLSHDSWEDIE